MSGSNRSKKETVAAGEAADRRGRAAVREPEHRRFSRVPRRRNRRGVINSLSSLPSCASFRAPPPSATSRKTRCLARSPASSTCGRSSRAAWCCAATRSSSAVSSSTPPPTGRCGGRPTTASWPTSSRCRTDRPADLRKPAHRPHRRTEEDQSRTLHARSRGLSVYMKGRFFWNKRTESASESHRPLRGGLEQDPCTRCRTRASRIPSRSWERPPSRCCRAREAMPRAQGRGVARSRPSTLAGRGAHTLAFVRRLYDWDWAEAEAIPAGPFAQWLLPDGASLAGASAV